MSNPFERRLFIGDIDHTPSQGPDEQSFSDEEFEQQKIEREIFPNVSERFEATLEANNYEQVTTLENGLEYPSLDQWLEVQFREKGRTSMYPSFIRDKNTNEIYFCKTRLKPRKDWGGLDTEAAILQHMPSNIPAPKLQQYIPEQPDTAQLEMLVTEAIKFSEGSVLPLSEWTSEHAQDAAQRVKQLETLEMKDIPDLPQEPAITIESVFDGCKEILEPDFRATIENILQEYTTYREPILIHGDLWLKNIIVSSNPAEAKTVFVDWERGGAGYRGQDAGRMWWTLWESEKTKKVVAESYLQESDPALQATRKAQLKFGVIFEAMRWLEDRNKVLHNMDQSDKHERTRADIKPIHEKAKAMLAAIDEADYGK